MKKVLSILVLCILLNINGFSQSGHSPTSPVPLTTTPDYSFTPNYLQNTSSTTANSNISNTSTTDIFINFDYDTTDDEVFVVYTTDGSAPTKTNGIVLNAGFVDYEDPNRVWKATLPILPGGTEVKYVIYSNSLNDGSDNLASANNRISPNGFETTWTEGDSSFGSNFVLPIKLSSFIIEKSALGQAELKWSSSSECNASHYEVERSTNGIDFETLATINAKASNCEGANYSYIDAIALDNVFATKVYYRLKMVDNDTYFDYSNLVDLTANSKNFVYYNFTNKELSINNITGTFQLNIINTNGNVVYQDKNQTIGSISLNDFDAGLYIVSVTKEDVQLTEKIIVQ